MITDASTVDEALRRLAGRQDAVRGERGVSGGCIASGRRVELTTGVTCFVKRSRTLPRDMFSAEAAGLAALGRAPGPRVPRVEAVWSGEGEGFIVMEWIEPGRKRSGTDAEFGRRLAELHMDVRQTRFGFEADNFIGATPQPNGWMESWHDFFRERRIRHQTQLARRNGLLDPPLERAIDSIVGRFESILPEPEHPSLLHGDLWGGNYLVDTDGRAVLIDPAAYYGHREADLAMTELFGGFSGEFYAAYREAWPLDPGFSARAELYNLYHMLNHANLFGGSYVASVRTIVRRYQ